MLFVLWPEPCAACGRVGRLLCARCRPIRLIPGEDPIEGLRAVRVGPHVRGFPLPGPITFGRGLQVQLEIDELAFQGGSAYLFGAVMEQFFARYASINSFTETLLRSSARGEIMRWAPRCGERAIL